MEEGVPIRRRAALGAALLAWALAACAGTRAVEEVLETDRTDPIASAPGSSAAAPQRASAAPESTAQPPSSSAGFPRAARYSSQRARGSTSPRDKGKHQKNQWSI